MWRFTGKTGSGDEPLYPSLGIAHLLSVGGFSFISFHFPTCWPASPHPGSSEFLCHLLFPVWGWGLLGVMWRMLTLSPFPAPQLTLSSRRNMSRVLPCGEQLTESSKSAPKLTEIHRSLKISRVRSVVEEGSQHCVLSCLSACCVWSKTLALSSFDSY